MENVKIVAVVGMSGSGKTTAVDYLKDKGVPKIRFGGVFYKLLEEMGVEPNLENTVRYQKELRETEGADFLMQRVAKEIEGLAGAGQHRVVLDGLYSWTEYKYLKGHFPGKVIVLAVVCAKKIRHKRVTARRDNERGYVMDMEEIQLRDRKEIEDLEKGGPIAMADYYIVNDGEISELYDSVDGLAREIGILE